MGNITLNMISLDPRIIHVTFCGAWTWKDVDLLMQQPGQPDSDQDQPLYIVADMTKTSHLPPSILVRTYNFLSHPPRNLRQTIVVTNNNFIEGMVGTFKRIFEKYQRAVAVVGSNEEALHLIKLSTGCESV